ncbi:MAG: phosphoglycerate dehydrogenase [Planctomycetota bacterium]
MKGPSKIKVLVTDPISADGVAMLKNAGFEVLNEPEAPPAKLKELIADCDGLIVRSRIQVDESLIDAGKRLRVIGRAGIGVDNIDMKAATRRGILVVNTPSASTITTAEHTISLLMSLARCIPQATASVKKGEWKRTKFVGVEIRSKTLGVVGLGKIGSEVARLAKGLGMKILAHDPFVSPDFAKKREVELVSLDDLFRNADFVTLHMPITEATKNLVNAKLLALAKPGLRIVNCARGGLLDEAAVLAAIKEGKVAGVALDVYPEEPPVNNPLVALDAVITTPHLGASTKEAQSAVALDVADQVLQALKGVFPTGLVNLPPIAPETYAAIKPWIPLADRMGAFAAQYSPGFVRSVEITMEGEISKEKTSLLTSAFLKGLLSFGLDEAVTLVNATPLAEERQISIRQSRIDVSPIYHSVLRALVKGSEREVNLVGAIIGREEPYIVEIDGFQTDFTPSGAMIVTRHRDKPGIVAGVARILAASGINISELHVGRESAGGEAIMVVGIDQPATKDILKDVQGVDGILSALLVNLPA